MAIIETSKIIVELAKKGMTIELQEKIMQLREEALELQEENLRLKTENLRLKKKVELQEKVKFKRKVYYREDDKAPLCPYCFEKSNLLIHLSGPTIGQRNNEQFYECQECATEYRTAGTEDFTIWSNRER